MVQLKGYSVSSGRPVGTTAAYALSKSFGQLMLVVLRGAALWGNPWFSISSVSCIA